MSLTDNKPVVTVVTVTTSSQTLAALLTTAGGSFDDDTVHVTLMPHTTGIYFASGTASGASAPMGLNNLQFSGGKESLDELAFYAAASTGMTVIQEF